MEACLPHEKGTGAAPAEHTLSGSNRVAVYGLLSFFTLFVYIFIGGGIDRAPRWFIALLAKPLQVSPGMLEARGSRVLVYRLEQWFWSHPYSKLILLLVLTVSLISLGSVSLFAVSTTASLYDTMWAAIEGVGLDWSFVGEGEDQVLVRFVSLLIAIGGTLITALLLGIISDALSQKVDELKRGRGAVLECNHYIIIGWSEKVISLIDQLCQGFETSGGTTIVVLSHKSKEEIDEEISNRVCNRRGSTIIVRKGDPMSRADLELISCSHASSIVILANATRPEQSDARTLRIVLCLMGIFRAVVEEGRECKTNVLAEMCNSDHENLLRMLVDEPRVRTIVSREMIGRFSVQCARYPALTNVLMELLGFAGNEFYLTEHKYSPMLAGFKFCDMQRLFRDAVPCGIRDASGVSKLSPPGDTIVKPGDQIILLAEDETGCDPTFDEHSPHKPLSPKEDPSQRNKPQHSDEGRSRSAFDASSLVRAATMRSKRKSEPASRNIVHTISARTMVSRPNRLSEAFSPPREDKEEEEERRETEDKAGSRVSSSTSRRTSRGTDAEADEPHAVAPGRVMKAEGDLCDGDGEATGLGTPSFALTPTPNDNRDTDAAAEKGRRSGKASDTEGTTEVAATAAAAARKRERALVRFSSSTKQRVQAKEQREEGSKPGQQHEEAQPLLPSLDESHEEHERQRKRGLQMRAREAALSGKLAAMLRAMAAERAAAEEGGQQHAGHGTGASLRRSSSGKIQAGMAQDWLAESRGDGPGNRSSHAAGSLAFGGLFLFCGWRQDIVGLIKVLDDFVTEDSELWLFSDVPLDTRRNLLVQGGLDVTCGAYCGLRHLKIRFDDPRLFGSSVLKRHMQALYPVQFTAILLLAEEPMVSEDAGFKAGGVTSTSGTRSVADIDSHTLSTLFLLRQIQVEDLNAGRLAPPVPLFKDPSPTPSPPADSSPAQSLSQTSSNKADSECAKGAMEAAACGMGSRPSPMPHASCDLKLSGDDATIQQQQWLMDDNACGIGNQLSFTPRASCDLKLVGDDLTTRQQQQQQLMDDNVLRPLEQQHAPISTPGPSDHAQAPVAPSISAADAACNGAHTPGNAGPRPWLEGCLIENPFFNTPASEEERSSSESSGDEARKSNVHAAGRDRQWCSSVTKRRLRKAERKLLLGYANGSRVSSSPHPVTSLLLPPPDNRPQEDSLVAPEHLQGTGAPSTTQPPHTLLHGLAAERSCAPQFAFPTQHPAQHWQQPQAPQFASSTQWPPQHWQQPQPPQFASPTQCPSQPGQQQQQAGSPAEKMLGMPGSETWWHGRACVHTNGKPAQPGIAPESCRETAGRGGRKERKSSIAGGEAAHTQKQLIPHASPDQGTPSRSASHSKMCKPSPPLLTPSDSLQRGSQSGLHSTTPQSSLRRRRAEQQQQQQQQHAPACSNHAHTQAGPLKLPPPKVPPTLGISVGSAAGPPDLAQTSPSMQKFRNVSRTVMAAASFKRRPPRHGTPCMNRSLDVLSDVPSDDPDLQDDAPCLMPPRSDNKWLNNPLLAQAVQRTVIVAELLDGGAHEMLKDMAIAQYMLSNELLSELLALVATCPERADILEGLLQAGGVELYLRPTWWLVEKGESISFTELSARASNQGEVLMGFIDKSRKSFLNPASKLEPRLSRATVEALVTTAWS